ncbi:Endonuclease/exonuclease/phosphatase, partial [Schizophyllum commune]
MRKASAKVASLNMNGFGSLVRDHPSNKWGMMCRMMNDKKIAILMLQETHMTTEARINVEKMYARNLKIINSAYPDNPTQSGGVAFVLNKRYVDTERVKVHVIEPGRALLIEMRWHGNETRRFLNIYAPSDRPSQRRDFFKRLREFFETHNDIPKPHVMAGDFNMTEDALDVAPIPPSAGESSSEEFDRLKIELDLKPMDGWRATYPDKRDYTHYGNTPNGPRASRIDRIYTCDETFKTAREWRIEDALIRSDHRLISVQVTSEEAPKVGRGRWRMPAFILRDNDLKKYTKERGRLALEEVRQMNARRERSELNNPQQTLAAFKRDVAAYARERQRAIVPRTMLEIKELRAELRAVNRNTKTSEEQRVRDGKAITEQIQRLEQRRAQHIKANARARHRLEGHTPTKYLSGLNKEVKSRELIYALETGERQPRSGDPIYEKDSEKMAELARKYHRDLQKDDREVAQDVREAAIKEALQSVESRLSEEQREELAHMPTRDELEEALKFSKNGSAPGLDGIPYEMWKVLNDRFIEDSRHEGRPTFDVLALVLAAFQDIYLYGVCEDTSFTDGWMCPLYKKNERTKISNYRPITLLNTDYKLLTKIMAIRL